MAEAIKSNVTSQAVTTNSHPQPLVNDIAGRPFRSDIPSLLSRLAPRTVEDGVLSQFSDTKFYSQYEDGPNRAVTDFLACHADDYVIDIALCDHFGHNVTYNPNAWLKRR